ncbi:g protein-coupled receptor [Anaeramoeba flamelloides]|uniref:G protein-coupled receptor n=1 Tax=Anaeramoeba flamelloides TaxID=1746091 RepID=A0AAV7ZTS8_9EUKA|nr:g protein-coupled receptor [Anaeramoeba flamelloides]
MVLPKDILNRCKLYSSIVSSLSILGSLFMVTSYLTFRELRISFTSKLIYLMSISNLFLGVSYLISIQGPCIFGAFLMQLWGQSHILLHLMITLNLDYFSRKGKDLREKLKLIYAVGYGVPLVTAIIPFITKSYGSADGAWCWIKYDESGKYERLIFYYIIVSCCCVYEIFVLIRLILQWNGESNKNTNTLKYETYKEVRKKILLYIFSLIVITFPGYINRSIQAFSNKESYIVLWQIHTILSPSHGIINAIIYSFHEKMKLPKSVSEFLDNKNSTKIFRQFCENRMMVENLDFLLVVYAFHNKSLRNNVLKVQTKNIIETYIENSSEKQINISSECRNKILMNYKSGDFETDIFNEALNQIENMLNKSIKTDFYESEERNQLVQFFREKEIKGNRVISEIFHKLFNKMRRKKYQKLVNYNPSNNIEFELSDYSNLSEVSDFSKQSEKRSDKSSDNQKYHKYWKSDFESSEKEIEKKNIIDH